ncbi:lysine N(6)-hydroxylase/L-ornithine N(5)-oxygenase family protein [Streptosporangium saharense]|uniref:L-lysine N6-monooxygenase MbtG n=1 Tax=Streptosporangium saharense TaxID=1706840 RepID=A0A7W7VMJ3_9ACTN|nr:lysine N(6)-hydroxylase/L-ornithine N(5)-oxygenase family protein [Streptosporangium saharense]MBB4915673.1 L-ornithine N5-oxygenase [Streptosporangium saharense]
MSESPAERSRSRRPLDLVGVGFGPANLALAVALREHSTTGTTLEAAFFERRDRFGWHPGMLLEGATLQVSFLKDLATLRNPASEYGFLFYLHAKGRLADFVNHKTLFPTRVEFNDYLEWVAALFAHQVTYGTTVRGARPVWDAHGDAGHIEVLGDDGEVLDRTRNLVLAPGLRPRLPKDVHVSERVWHNADLLTRLADLPPLTRRRFAVVGAGQSAAEVTDHLHRNYPEAEVYSIFTRYGYSPADDSPFANRIFDAEAVDEFHAAPEDVRRSLLDYHANTNYSVVDLELIEELYRRAYQEKVVGRERLRILNVSRVVGLDEVTDGVRVHVDHLATGASTVLDCDAVVFATGYRPVDPAELLGDLAGHCRLDDEGRLLVGADYRVLTDPSVKAGIYLQGGTEYAHGLSSSLLSNVAVRAGDVVRSIAGGTRDSGVPGVDPASVAALS